jgi:hypothetical protein
MFRGFVLSGAQNIISWALADGQYSAMSTKMCLVSAPVGHGVASRSVLVGQHDRDDSVGYRRVSWIGGMVGEGPIKIIDLEKDRLTFSLE